MNEINNYLNKELCNPIYAGGILAAVFTAVAIATPWFNPPYEPVGIAASVALFLILSMLSVPTAIAVEERSGEDNKAR